MDESSIMELTVNAMSLVLMVSLAPILVATFTGLLVSLLQALTQIQEQTLSFAVKLIAVSLTLLVTGRWLGGELYNFTMTILERFPLMVP